MVLSRLVDNAAQAYDENVGLLLIRYSPVSTVRKRSITLNFDADYSQSLVMFAMLNYFYHNTWSHT